MTTAKKWTKDDQDSLGLDYPSYTIAQLAHSYERSEKSIIAKLTSMGIYEKTTVAKKEAVAKKETIGGKDEIVGTIAILLGLKVDEIASLSKANKNDLINIQEAIIRCAHFKDNKK